MSSGFSLKAATVIAAGTLALGGGAAAAASTPSVQHGLSSIASGWGQQVSEKVEACQGARQTGEHGDQGIGKCVSAFAKTHGKTVSAGAHARNDAREDAREAADSDRDGGRDPDEAAHGRGRNHSHDR